MNSMVERVIDEIINEIPKEDHDNRPLVAKTVRHRARITCRQLGDVLGLLPSQISDIEHSRLDVSDDVIIAWLMVCASKIVVKKEMERL